MWSRRLGKITKKEHRINLSRVMCLHIKFTIRKVLICARLRSNTSMSNYGLASSNLLIANGASPLSLSIIRKSNYAFGLTIDA